MSQTAKAQEPSMEEILASIRRIIADEDGTKSAKPPEPAAPKPPPPAARPASPPPPSPAPPLPPAAAAGNGQTDIDAMLAELDQPPAPKLEAKPEPKPEPPKPAAAAPPPPVDVLDLTEDNVAPTPPPGPAPTFRTIDGDSDVVFTDRAPSPPPAPPPELPRGVEEVRAPFPQMTMTSERGLLSSDSAAAVDSAFNALAHTILGQNARTLEDLVKEMLRPMLKSWLDDNLPGLVERIVRAEIERVSRGKP
jgi:cell pole-organizing protein PopZ